MSQLLDPKPEHDAFLSVYAINESLDSCITLDGPNGAILQRLKLEIIRKQEQKATPEEILATPDEIMNLKNLENKVQAFNKSYDKKLRNRTKGLPHLALYAACCIIPAALFTIFAKMIYTLASYGFSDFGKSFIGDIPEGILNFLIVAVWQAAFEACVKLWRDHENFIRTEEKIFESEMVDAMCLYEVTNRQMELLAIVDEEIEPKQKKLRKTKAVLEFCFLLIHFIFVFYWFNHDILSTNRIFKGNPVSGTLIFLSMDYTFGNFWNSSKTFLCTLGLLERPIMLRGFMYDFLSLLGIKLPESVWGWIWEKYNRLLSFVEHLINKFVLR